MTTTRTLNAYELWQERRRVGFALNYDATGRWYRVARPNGQARYGWGDEIVADAWAWLLNDREDLTVNLYVATPVEDADLRARLDRGNEGVNLDEALATLGE